MRLPTKQSILGFPPNFFMKDNSDIIHTRVLKDNLDRLARELEEIDERRGSIKKEMEAISLVLERYSGKRSAFNPNQLLLSHYGRTLSTDESRKAIIAFLQERGRPMKSALIRQGLESRGINIPQATFDWIMSRESRDSNSPVKKIAYGTYFYSPTLLAEDLLKHEHVQNQ